MAEVFRAKQFGVEGFERLVAVKRILPSIAEDKDFIEMFVDEAKIAVQLNHANIAQVFNLGHEDGSYFIALEHVHGRDLRAIFDRNRNQGEPMPVPQACFVIMKVCEGLDYAHNKRDDAGRDLALVHRDVSPQNVLVSFDGEIKLIDFGIAKAAGKGAQTQAGILKGKFGYMSPEQVRGLPVDRRSDVFACGIVLYELLTGERLFVGESDFSTLEKVRNVEILPPSTYNRKIQPELERIVLKALAKDVEDRYQNAIDLHDELQAFVYTAGEFYSRKDLASWMKQVWAKEIKEESTRIASYRDMAPPEKFKIEKEFTGSTRQLTQPAKSQARKTNPPPIPGSRGPSTNPPPFRAEKAKKGAGLEWDDDELETSIYDEDQPESTAPPLGESTADLPAAPMAAAAGETADLPGPTVAPLSGSALTGDTQVTPTEEPDLSSLVATSQGWDAPQSTPDLLPSDDSPSRVADGSNKTQSPFVGTGAQAELASASSPSLAQPSQEVLSSGFGSSIVTPPRRSNLIYGLIAASILIAGGIVAVVLASQGGESSESGESAVAQPSVADDEKTGGPVTPVEVATGIADADTGFDLIVDPQGVKVSLDGRPIGKAPLQIRSLRPGNHYIEIEAPNGFFSKAETVSVAEGSAERVVIRLDAMDITGKFVSEPKGASVSLVADGISQPLGPAPVEHNLDPRKRYEVVFEKDGYVTVTKPVEITGSPVVSVAGTLSRARVSSRPVPPVSSDPVEVVKPKPKPVDPKPVDTVVERPKPKPVAAGTGTLLLSAKPPCKIFINGRDTGKMTPQRKIELPVGSHRITLVNNEHGIKDSFTVKIKADTATKSIKNFTDQIK
jgi:serine/threonine protein kinase